jgi:hypothetical protein
MTDFLNGAEVMGQSETLFTTGERFDRWMYDFRCPACGSAGELAVPKAYKTIECPERCGARFIQWIPLSTAAMPKPPMALRCINEREARFTVATALARGRMPWS